MELVDVCNAALAKLGEDTTLTTLTASTTSKNERTLYHQHLLTIKKVMRELNWPDLLETAQIPATESDIVGFTSYYDIPSDCMRISRVTDTDDDPIDEWVHKKNRIYAKYEDGDILLEYVAYDEDPDHWEPALLDCIITALARDVCRVIVADNGEMRKLLNEEYNEAIEKARGLNLMEAGTQPAFTPTIRNARTGATA